LLSHRSAIFEFSDGQKLNLKNYFSCFGLEVERKVINSDIIKKNIYLVMGKK